VDGTIDSGIIRRSDNQQFADDVVRFEFTSEYFAVIRQKLAHGIVDFGSDDRDVCTGLDQPVQFAPRDFTASHQQAPSVGDLDE